MLVLMFSLSAFRYVILRKYHEKNLFMFMSSIPFFMCRPNHDTNLSTTNPSTGSHTLHTPVSGRMFNPRKFPRHIFLANRRIVELNPRVFFTSPLLF